MESLFIIQLLNVIVLKWGDILVDEMPAIQA